MHPLPIRLLVLPDQRIHLGMFLRIAQEHAGTDQVGGVAHRMHERLGVVDDESPRGDSLLQPRHEMLVACLIFVSVSRVTRGGMRDLQPI